MVWILIPGEKLSDFCHDNYKFHIKPKWNIASISGLELLNPLFLISKGFAWPCGD